MMIKYLVIKYNNKSVLKRKSYTEDKLSRILRDFHFNHFPFQSMKKYILIFVLILLQFKSLNSQTIASYMLFIKSYGVHINLFDTNKYILSLTIALSLDDISEYDLSYGTFTEEGNKLILKDKINGSEINLLKEDNDLLTDKGLVCFNNQSFIYTNNLFLFSNNYKELDSIANLKYKEIIHNNESCNINVGKYSSDKAKYEININSNKKYEYKIDDVIISKGNYKINGNTLYFYDEYLWYTFKAEIIKDTITNSNLPGYFDNIKFHNMSNKYK